MYSSLPIFFLSCYLCPFLFSAPTLHCSPCLSELYLSLSVSVWMRALGQRWVGVSIYLILFKPLSHPYFYTLSQRLSFFLSVCVYVYVFLCLSLCVFLPLSSSRCLFFFLFFGGFSLLRVHLFPFFSLPCWLPPLSPSSLLVLASSFQVSLSLSVCFSPPHPGGTQRMMFTQSLMGGKALTCQKGASKPGKQPVWKLIMRFHSD